MKKEFGKWFLDLAKYILTAVFLTTYLKGIEGSSLVWFAAIGFLLTLFIGYLLLKAADREGSSSSNRIDDAIFGNNVRNKQQSKKSKK